MRRSPTLPSSAPGSPYANLDDATVPCVEFRGIDGEPLEFAAEDRELEMLIYGFGPDGISATKLAAFLTTSRAQLAARISSEEDLELGVAIHAARDAKGEVRYRHSAWLGLVRRYRGAWGPPDPPRPQTGVNEFGVMGGGSMMDHPGLAALLREWKS